MPLSSSVQIALSLLQVTGLLLPIVFIALQPFYEQVVQAGGVGPGSQHPTPKKFDLFPSDEDGSPDSLVSDNPPRVIYAGAAVIGFLLLSTIFAVLRILLALTDDWLVILSASCLLFGLAGLGVLYYFIRTEYRTVLDAV
ncbi:hypothetical protein NDI56_20870 [Haloarcula sp. S1CR25-12]|uniref:Uncharacterized protein n=1 Tax=Haloarcula saliterrae TaxID=2950534 RepID=A0ABU2FJD4_9EURY|nr:hypothetical protein [Haloarcula sp. S1CR25-12]MDS0261861.1 hypothetical protein [Haloarcula sp. S1CR25-12]